MATALKLVEDKGMDKQKALETALGQIERNFGKGSIMRLGEQKAMDVEALSTGSLSLDVALGIVNPRGFIGIQGEAGRLEYRKIEVRE